MILKENKDINYLTQKIPLSTQFKVELITQTKIRIY